MRDVALGVAIRAAHQASRQSYGTRQIHAELRAQGYEVGREKVGRIPQQMGLRCVQSGRLRL